MRDTTIVLGPPGTGKTTHLLNQIETSPEHVAFFAFTRKAANEAVTRATAKFNCDKDDLPWFRTLHSTAYKLAGITRTEVMTNDHYDQLSESLGNGFTFQHTYTERLERAPPGGGLGDRCFSIYSLARARMISVTDQWALDRDPHVGLRDALRFETALDQYKKEMKLYDFSDFLDLVDEPIPLDLLIIDEAQDLTRQQWAFVRRIGARAHKVIIAGDDDQAIFQWAGADLYTFLSIKGNVKVLPKSYRLSEMIWRLANSITRQIKSRQKKEWKANDGEPGAVKAIPDVYEVELKGPDTWYLLARNNHQLPGLVQLCRDQGFVYWADGEWSNDNPAVRAVVWYERIRRGETLSGDQAALVTQHIPGMTRSSASLHNVTWNMLSWPFEGKPDWMEALRGLGLEQREYIRKVMRQGESLTQPGRIVVSTIHGVKGGEADNVLLLTDISSRTHAAMSIDIDQELRVWYVAVSRAKKTVFLLAPKTQRFFQF